MITGPRRRARRPLANAGRTVNAAAMALIASASILAAIAAITAIVAGGLRAGHGGVAPGVTSARAREMGPAGVAAAYGFPVGCLSITLARSDPRYARADFDHATPCGRYAGSTSAIFERSHGAWRVLLISPSYSCPVASLPAAVQAELAVCP